jgi:hypothetical protein
MAMVTSRRSPTDKANQRLREESPDLKLKNKDWLARLENKDGIILLGGTSVADFRVRVAQSRLRSDMMPSFWSHCGILLEGGKHFISAPFNFSDVSAIPKCNGVQECYIEEFDDPDRYPNVAVIRFAKVHDNVQRDLARVREDRSIIDLPALMLPWLGFLWGTTGSANPLQSGIGLPSAALVETVFAMAGFELTPGLSSASSCPEAIWQSAKWWTQYYEGSVSDAKALSGDEVTTTTADQDGAQDENQGEAVPARQEELPAALPMVPTGFAIIRQRAAAAMDF